MKRIKIISREEVQLLVTRISNKLRKYLYRNAPQSPTLEYNYICPYNILKRDSMTNYGYNIVFLWYTHDCNWLVQRFEDVNIRLCKNFYSLTCKNLHHKCCTCFRSRLCYVIIKNSYHWKLSVYSYQWIPWSTFTKHIERKDYQDMQQMIPLPRSRYA